MSLLVAAWLAFSMCRAAGHPAAQPQKCLAKSCQRSIFLALSSCAKLLLVDNLFDDVPPGVLAMPALKTLDLSLNQLQSLPESVVGLSRLGALHVDSNPFYASTFGDSPPAPATDEPPPDRREM